jgi:protein KRI1
MAKDKMKKAAKAIKLDASDDYVSLDVAEARPTKKVKLLDDSDDDTEGDGDASLKVNEEYARRFEHNKKRAEQHRCRLNDIYLHIQLTIAVEEKYGKKSLKDGEDEEDSEDDEDEDDDAELATETLDAEISATLNAIRSKDPRVYDTNVTFYQAPEEGDESGSDGKPAEKSMTLRDYHTKNLLEGRFEQEDDEPVPRTYAQEQEHVRQNLVKQLHNEDSDDEEDDFLVAKLKPEPPQKRVKITEEDVEKADKDPDTFLSNFMASRAWVPDGQSKWKPLESDDEEEEARAEEYEDAYNRYFEDPSEANQKIVTYARDAVASATVRRDEKSSRHKAREAARAKREAERREKEEDLARLRKLKIDEMESKVKQIRQVAGLSGRDFKMDDWADVLEADWSDDQWDNEMRKRFGDAYYDGEDAEALDSEDDTAGKSKKKKPKKPKFDDDIDIKDLIPEFVDDDDEEPAFTLSDENEDEDEAMPDAEQEEDEDKQSTKKSSKQRKQERADAKSSARRDRRLIEKLVDSNLEYEATMAAKAKAPMRFRYRETSPTTFGLTPRDILLASDAQLNEFAGLKKLATFRDPAKKKKDKKHLSKKARLKQWRTDTFGDPDGPKGGFESILGEEISAGKAGNAPGGEDDGVDIREGGSKKKKKRSRKRKAGADEI